MSILPIYKKCPICRRKYTWNPDVGILTCPRCKDKQESIVKLLSSLTKRK